MSSVGMRKYLKRHIKDDKSAYSFLANNLNDLDEETIEMLLGMIQFSDVHLRNCITDLALSEKYRIQILERIVQDYSPHILRHFEWNNDFYLSELSVMEKRAMIKKSIRKLDKQWLEYIVKNEFLSSENSLMQQVEAMLLMIEMVGEQEEEFEGHKISMRIIKQRSMQTFKPMFFDYTGLIKTKEEKYESRNKKMGRP